MMALLAVPAVAQDRQDADRCAAGWTHLVGIVTGYRGAGQFDVFRTDDKDRWEDFPHTPIADGWCRVIPPKIVGAPELERIEWRATPMTFSDNPQMLPNSIEMRAIEMDQPTPFEVSISLSHLPSDGLLIFDKITVVFGGGEAVVASAVVGGAFFNDPRAVQMSLPGLHLDQLAVTAAITPDRVAALDLTVSREDVVQFVSNLSFAQMDRGSKAEALKLAADLPAPHGVLDLTFASARGLGWMQIIAAGDQDDAEFASFLLDGAQVSVDWRPE